MEKQFRTCYQKLYVHYVCLWRACRCGADQSITTAALQIQSIQGAYRNVYIAAGVESACLQCNHIYSWQRQQQKEEFAAVNVELCLDVQTYM